MKVALISDLHGNVPALEAVLADIQARGADRIVCLGDIVDLGPEPGLVIRMLQDRSIPCLVGNHDPFLGDPIVPVDVYEWTFAQLSPTELLWLRGLPHSLQLQCNDVRLLCVHGSPRSFDEQILSTTSDADLAEMVRGFDFDVLACGHTHVQLAREMNSQLFVNCGSVAMPFVTAYAGGPAPRVRPWAEYAMVTCAQGRGTAELLRADYDIAEYFARVRRSSMPDPEQWIASWEPVQP